MEPNGWEGKWEGKSKKSLSVGSLSVLPHIAFMNNLFCLFFLSTLLFFSFFSLTYRIVPAATHAAYFASNIDA